MLGDGGLRDAIRAAGCEIPKRTDPDADAENNQLDAAPIHHD
jgi:hypothetical protein